MRPKWMKLAILTQKIAHSTLSVLWCFLYFQRIAILKVYLYGSVEEILKLICINTLFFNLFHSEGYSHAHFVFEGVTGRNT